MENAETELLRQAFGVVLRKMRKQRAWSQEELAHRAGIAMRYVSLLETNNRQPTLSTLHVIAQAFDLSVSELMQAVENEAAETFAD